MSSGARSARGVLTARPWRAPLGLAVAAVVLLAGVPALTQGVASGDGDGTMATAAELTLSAAARQVGTYRSAAAVIARRAATEDPGATGAAGAVDALAASTTTAPAPPTTSPAPVTTAAPAPPPVEAAPMVATTVAPPPPTAPPAPEPPPPAPAETPAATQPPPAPVVAALAAPAPAAVAAAPGTDPASEARFLELVNGLRASLGLGPLGGDGRLQGAARGWARSLADQGGLAHQDLNQYLDAWYAAGENVAFGPSADAIFNALVSSPRHYANMARGDFSVVGIGVVVGPDGKLWTSHVFAG